MDGTLLFFWPSRTQWQSVLINAQGNVPSQIGLLLGIDHDGLSAIVYHPLTAVCDGALRSLYYPALCAQSNLEAPAADPRSNFSSHQDQASCSPPLLGPPLTNMSASQAPLTMKAAVARGFGKPDDVLSMSLDTPRPPAPKKGEMLVRVQACSLTPGDWRCLNGEKTVIFSPKTWPYVPGLDVWCVVFAARASCWPCVLVWESCGLTRLWSYLPPLVFCIGLLLSAIMVLAVVSWKK